jgi:aminoglycoside 3-N-acetyltransferase
MKMKQLLFKTGDKEIYDSDFLEALRTAGIENGDLLLVHSDITTFGKLALFDRNALCQALTDALQVSVGADGTLVMPTFTYSFCKHLPYDVDASPSTVGVLTEFFRKLPSTVRTLHPIFSVGISGKLSKDLHKIDKDAFGENSIFGRIRARKGKLVFLGTSLQACTFIHHVEQMHGVPYRFIKTFPGIIKQGNKEFEAEATYLVRYLDKNVNLDLKRFEQHLLKTQIMTEVKIGEGRLLVVDAEELFQEGLKLLDEDIFYFLKDKPT